MYARHIGTAFAKGTQVASGHLTEAAAREWIGSVVCFAAAHPGAAETGDPDEISEALEKAFEAGKALGIPIPLPTQPGSEQ